MLSTLIACGPGEPDGPIEISTMDPQTGPMQAETAITIGGANFRSDIGYTVFFGNQRASDIMILDSQTLLVSAPTTESAGAVDVQIRAENGQAWRLPEAFTYVDGGGNLLGGVGGDQVEGEEGSGLAY